MNRHHPRRRDEGTRAAWTALTLSLPRPATRCLTSALAAATLLTGCLGEERPDPEVQPLEIIVGEDGSCGLNVSVVGAGTHHVTPIVATGEATVRILGPSAKVVFTRTVAAREAEGGGNLVVAEDEGSVRLRAGAHRVECISSEGTQVTELRVVPARPGHRRPTG